MDKVKRKFNLHDKFAIAEILGDYNPVHLET